MPIVTSDADSLRLGGRVAGHLVAGQVEEMYYRIMYCSS